MLHEQAQSHRSDFHQTNRLHSHFQLLGRLFIVIFTLCIYELQPTFDSKAKKYQFPTH